MALRSPAGALPKHLRPLTLTLLTLTRLLLLAALGGSASLLLPAPGPQYTSHLLCACAFRSRRMLGPRGRDPRRATRATRATRASGERFELRVEFEVQSFIRDAHDVPELLGARDPVDPGTFRNCGIGRGTGWHCWQASTAWQGQGVKRREKWSQSPLSLESLESLESSCKARLHHASRSSCPRNKIAQAWSLARSRARCWRCSCWPTFSLGWGQAESSQRQPAMLEAVNMVLQPLLVPFGPVRVLSFAETVKVFF